MDPDVGAGLVLRADVDAGGLVVAHQDGGQAGGDPVVGERPYPLGHLRADLRGDGSAVEDAGGHGPGCYRLTTGAASDSVPRISATSQ